MEAKEESAKGTPFAFSWADEVEREEEQEQQQAKKANPFGAARAREVVLEERGVDWHVRDLELDPARPAHRERNQRARPRHKQADQQQLAVPPPRPGSLARVRGGGKSSRSENWSGVGEEVVVRFGEQRRVLGDLNTGKGSRKRHKKCSSGARHNAAEGGALVMCSGRGRVPVCLLPANIDRGTALFVSGGGQNHVLEGDGYVTAPRNSGESGAGHKRRRGGRKRKSKKL